MEVRGNAIDEREHRRGLVLGLTLAEVLLLLLFLLMLALASRIQAAHKERDVFAAAVKVLRPLEIDTRAFAQRVQRLDVLEKRVAELEELNSNLRKAMGALKYDPAKIAAAASVIEWASKIDPNDPPAVLKRATAVLETLGTATRPNDVAAFSKMKADVDAKAKVFKAVSAGRHNWPPIITLSEAEGYFFDKGSAELSESFRTALSGKVIARLLETTKEYDVDVIEVIGHTDEQRIVERPSNLDKSLIPFLQNKPRLERFVPADNAGLGIARAASVTRALGADERLAGFTILPFSAAQLIDVGDKLATGINPGDVKERRRIEVRVRRSHKEANTDDRSWGPHTQIVPPERPVEPWEWRQQQN